MYTRLNPSKLVELDLIDRGRHNCSRVHGKHSSLLLDACPTTFYQRNKICLDEFYLSGSVLIHRAGSKEFGFGNTSGSFCVQNVDMDTGVHPHN